MSRNTKLTPDAARLAVELARKGVPKTTIAKKLRVHRDTVHEWLSRADKEPDSIFAAFALDFHEAQADFEIASLDDVNAGGETWKASAWALEKLFPETYTARAAIEHSGPDGGPLQHAVVASVVILPALEADDADATAPALAAGGLPPDAAPGDVPGEPRG